MRDGYIIPVKMFINSLIILACVALWNQSAEAATAPRPGNGLDPAFDSQT